MQALKVVLVEYVDDSFPGWIKCRFEDVHGQIWEIIEKVPVLSTQALDSSSDFPIESFIACEVKSQSDDVITIDTSKPWGISEVGGKFIFEVYKHQLTEIEL
jgi:hypothetical protein